MLLYLRFKLLINPGDINMANQVQGNAASIAANARAQLMMQDMQNVIAQQNTALDQAMAQPAPNGQGLCEAWNNVKTLDRQISILRKVILPALGQNPDVLAPINTAFHALEGRFAPVRVLEISVPRKSGNLQTRHSGVHNKIMSFVGLFGRTINAICCNDIPPAAVRPLTLSSQPSLFEMSALSANRDKSEFFFASLRGKERTRAEHFLCMATEEDPAVFDSREAIHACSDQELFKAGRLMTAERSIQSFDLSLYSPEMRARREKQGARLWTSLFEDQTDDLAKKIMMRHVWLLEGCTDCHGNPLPLDKDKVSLFNINIAVSQLKYEDTVGKFNHAVYVALFRLARNGLRLLRTQPERNVVAMFAKTMERPSAHNPQTLEAAYTRLKSESRDAAKLLAFIFGHRASACPDDWERILLAAKTPEHIKRIQGIADLLAESENGRLQEELVLPEVTDDLGFGDDFFDDGFDCKEPTLSASSGAAGAQVASATASLTAGQAAAFNPGKTSDRKSN
jgi:hypothetical protein